MPTVFHLYAVSWVPDAQIGSILCKQLALVLVALWPGSLSMTHLHEPRVSSHSGWCGVRDKARNERMDPSEEMERRVKEGGARRICLSLIHI